MVSILGGKREGKGSTTTTTFNENEANRRDGMNSLHIRTGVMILMLATPAQAGDQEGITWHASSVM